MHSFEAHAAHMQNVLQMQEKNDVGTFCKTFEETATPVGQYHSIYDMLCFKNKKVHFL